MAYLKHIFNKEKLEDIRFEDIQRLIDNRMEEFNQLEYKGVYNNKISYEGVAKAISGLLNSSGGIIIVGISEKVENGHHLPDKFTWTTYTNKDSLENSLYTRLQPWHENIKIFPVENPRNVNENIFLIDVPKSNNPPHMANHIYYTRLNSQTQELGHEQVVSMIKLNYIQKFDLQNTVYGPIFNELYIFYNEAEIKELHVINYYKVLNERAFLLEQDEDLALELGSFYQRVEKYNKAIKPVKYRLAKLITAFATKYFHKRAFSHSFGMGSALSIWIKTETMQQSPCIDDALLNKQQPLDFWKKDFPHDEILDAQFILMYQVDNKIKTQKIPKEEFNQFIEKLKPMLDEDDLIKHVRSESERLKSLIEGLFDLLSNNF
ncbi:MAG: ATP-binding protein [Candidatus Bathyarchaeota archaeon]|nr:ATP-binding protein [Candidatus Bathyarchaeota archaeon]